jgi:hypothetical protein
MGFLRERAPRGRALRETMALNPEPGEQATGLGDDARRPDEVHVACLGAEDKRFYPLLAREDARVDDCAKRLCPDER